MSFAVSLQSPSISRSGSVLACYSLPGEEREVMGYDQGSGVALFDRPAGGAGEGHLIDRGVFWTGSLASLVAEYVEHAKRLGCPPASKEGIGMSADALEYGEAAVFLRSGGGWS